MRRLTALVACLNLATCMLYRCSATSPSRAEGTIALLKPSAMYLGPEPYRKICVEMDAVEGAEPQNNAVNALVEFLHTYSKKPVTVVRKKPIRRAAAEGIRPALLALQNMEGTCSASGHEPSAYIYVLFYRGSGPRKLWKPAVGAYVRGDYPCAIFVDMSVFRPRGEWMLPNALKHEAGHILGLCGNPAHGDGEHCRNKNCLMHKGMSRFKTLLRLSPTDLCGECKRDLLEMRESGALSRDMEFKGPILVRKERGYYVGMLPSLCHLGLGSVEDCDCEAVIREAREQVTKANRPGLYIYTSSHDIASRAEFLKKRSALEAALKDRNPRVVETARMMKESLEEEFGHLAGAEEKEKGSADTITINATDDGYRGIWYMNQPSHDEYVYKYSGGLGTYCAKHKPFAVYCDKVNKTFFCYGGTTADSNSAAPALLHMVSYYDRWTRMAPRPTILLDKKTGDAHDNPVISVDDRGYIWIFSTSHGASRPSYIHRSKKPYDIAEFELVRATKMENFREVPMTNFSYMQAWHVRGKGFLCFFTRYNYPAARTICFMTSPDGVKWSKWIRLAAIDEGHYQVSGVTGNKAGTAFNFHPEGKGLNWRTNLYYIETADFGKTWRTVDGKKLTLPLREVRNPALVHDYRAEGLNVYLKDIRFDEKGMPVILFLTSRGFASGPRNDPRTWTTARWTGKEWEVRAAMVSDNNYDMGSLYLEDDGTWRIIAPTETGPQPYNTGGEMAMWISEDFGKTWRKIRQLTRDSKRNHTYARHPVNAHPDFYALWADGHGRKPSQSTLYFCDKKGNVRSLPREMKGEFERPRMVK